MMSPKDWFGVGLRLAGVWCALQSCTQLMDFVVVQLRLSSDRVMTVSGEQVINPQVYLPYAVGYAALALLLVLRTDYFVQISFRSAEPPTSTDADS